MIRGKVTEGMGRIEAKSASDREDHKTMITRKNVSTLWKDISNKLRAIGKEQERRAAGKTRER